MKQRENRVHLDFLDGIRGLAALYVFVIMHSAAWILVSDAPHRRWVLAMSPFISEGKLAVAVFIVLSGFCLTLPVTHAGTHFTCAAESWAYLKRRGRRDPPHITLPHRPCPCLSWP